MKKNRYLFVLMLAIIASFSFVSCSENETETESEEYSEWAQAREADFVIYAKAREAYLDDPANASSKNFMIMRFLSGNPYAVRTKAVKNGKNYQFAFNDYVVTVCKGNGDEIGKVIEVEVGFDEVPPFKRDE